MRITYRRGTIADASKLAEFATRAFTQTYAAFNTAEDMREYLAASFGVEQQKRELADPTMITVLAEADGALTGYAQVRRKERPPSVTQEAPAEIYRLYVDASAHGKGVAQRLMDESMNAARDLGAKHLWLGVWERNARAIAFYRKCGFAETGEQHFQLGSDRQRDLVMVRPVGESCGECGAPLDPGRSCRDYFNDLLALEWRVPGGPGDRAHFLAVASYNLQHPLQFTPDMVTGLRETFGDVLSGRATVADALARARAETDGPTRVLRNAADPAIRIAGWPTHWPMTVRDVCDAPVSSYLERLQAWATSVNSAFSGG